MESSISDHFILHIGGKDIGPLKKEEVFNLLKTRKVSISDKIYNSKTKSWKLVGELDEFSSFLPPRPPATFEKPLGFYVYSEGKVQGPFSLVVVQRKLKENELTYFDHILAIEGQKMWIRILESSLFRPENLNHKNASGSTPSASSSSKSAPPLSPQTGVWRFQDINPNSLTGDRRDGDGDATRMAYTLPPSAQAAQAAQTPQVERKKDPGLNNTFEIRNDPVWIIEKGEGELGPFRYLEVLKMIQKNVITKNDRIKKVSDEAWRKIYDLFEFNTKVIKKIVQEGGKKVEKFFLTRQHKRSSYLAPTKLEFKSKIYSGICSSISVGGCFIEIRPDDFVVNSEVMLKIMSSTIPVVIESKATVVSINERNPRGIGLRFFNLSPEMANEIQKFINKFAEK